MKHFKHIGNLIKEKRVHSGQYSQSQLSEILGYKNGQFISNIERGKCGIPLKQLKRFISVLSIGRQEIKDALIKDYEQTIDEILFKDAGEEFDQAS